jgi:hypothetical protein
MMSAALTRGVSGRESRAISTAPMPTVNEVFIADAKLDEKMAEMAAQLGLKGPQAEAILMLPKDKQREMLKGFTMTQAQQASGGRENEPRAYVSTILDDPTLDELAEAAAWLATAPIAKVEQFASKSAKGTEALSSVLSNLCRYEERSESDDAKVRAAPPVQWYPMVPHNPPYTAAHNPPHGHPLTPPVVPHVAARSRRRCVASRRSSRRRSACKPSSPRQ